VIDGDRIAAIGPAGQGPGPGRRGDRHAEGKTIIPGLIDVHAHGSQGEDGITPEQNWLHYASSATG
jgi:imidazolonepropionase-like amidohydrolase